MGHTKKIEVCSNDINSCFIFRYPITRDCFVYCLTIIILIIVLIDSQVYWYESLCMVGASGNKSSQQIANRNSPNWETLNKYCN